MKEIYQAIFTGESYLNSRVQNYMKKLYPVRKHIPCIMYLMYSSYFFLLISLELFPSLFKPRKRQTFDGIPGKNVPTSPPKWCIRVTCANVPTDHRRLTSKEQPWNLASKRENKDQLRVNLPLSLTSPPYYPSNPQNSLLFEGRKRRKEKDGGDERRKKVGVQVGRIEFLFPLWISLEFSISPASYDCW